MAQLTDEQFDLLMEALETMQPDSQELRLVVQGITLGFGEEAEALLRTPFQSGSYTEIRDNLRTKLNAHRERAPIEAAAYEMAGAAIPAIATMGASSPLSLANATRPLVRAAQIGLAEGGIAAVGTSEREGIKSLKDAPLGMGLGAVAGPMGYLGGKYLGVAADKVLEFLRQRGSKKMGTVVEKELKRLADQTGLSQDELVGRIAAGETMSDDPNLHMAVRSYMSQGGGAETAIRATTPARATAARDSAKEAVQVGLTGRTDNNVLKAARMSQDEWKAAEGGAYKNIFADAGEVTPELSRQALEAVKRIPNALSEMNSLYGIRNLVPLFKTADNGAIELSRIPTLEDVEMIRRVASESAGNAYREGRGTVGSELKALEMNLRSNIDSFSPALSDARAGWARMSQARDAFDDGKKAFTGDVEAFEVLAEGIMGSGDAAKISAFREGIMSSINNKMAIGGSKRFLGKMANPESREGRVFANVFPQDQQKKVLAKLALSGKTQLSYEKIVEGSTTQLAKDAGKQQGLSIGMDEILSASAGNLSSGIGIGMKAIKSLAPSLSDSQRRQITEVLLSDDPNFVRSALKDSGKMAQLQEKVQNLSRMITAGATGAAAYSGGVAGQQQTQGLLGEM
mgnify:FL=1